MRESASCGLSNACSIRPSSSRWLWFSLAARVVLLQTLQRQDEQLAVVFVRERRERDGENLRDSNQCTVVV